MKKKIFATRELTASALADELFDKINGASKILNIAVSGGSTPSILFRNLAERYGDKIDWSKVRFFWVDERSVSPEDDQSNYKMTARSLLNHVEIPAENIFRVLGENDTKDEAERYSVLIKKIVPSEEDIPSFDIILLGIGDDGHTASIFPNQMELLHSDKICEMAIHPQSGQKRVSLTGKTINKGKNIYFLVCGSDKKAIIGKILNKDPLYPASFIRNKDNNVTFYMDADAAEDL